MLKKLKFLKKVKILNDLRRVVYASSYFNAKYLQILKWGFSSNEDTNYTYNLTANNLDYLAKLIAVITNASYGEIINYINEINNDEELKEHVQKCTKESKYRKYADAEVRFGKRAGWYAFARVMKPKLIVETGVDKGLGSVVLSAALLKNKAEGFEGNYIGTDIDPKAGYLLKDKYAENAEILYGDSIESLQKLDKTIDLFINDSDHSTDYEYREYQTIKQLINNKSVILGDNSHFSEKLVKFSIEENREFLFFQEKPQDHWYPGGGIGISFKDISS